MQPRQRRGRCRRSVSRHSICRSAICLATSCTIYLALINCSCTVEAAEKRIAELASAGCAPVAFICEPLVGNAGGVELPPGYLRRVYQAVRRVGGLCISDEVQVGYAAAVAFLASGTCVLLSCSAEYMLKLLLLLSSLYYYFYAF